MASLADYQTALRQVVFSSTNPSPGTGDRGIQVTVNDGALNSNIATTYMHVASAPPNAAPALDLDANNTTTNGADYLTTFTEGSGAVAIADTDVLISDSDDTEIASATITLTNHSANDVLVFTGSPPAGISVSAYDPATGILTLTGNASLADYQIALRQITFNNTGPTPSTETRIIEVVVNDGTANSNTAHAYVAVEDLPPGPGASPASISTPTTRRCRAEPITRPSPRTARRSRSWTPMFLSPTRTAQSLGSATITLINQETGDLLSVSGPLLGGITASSYDPVTGVLTLSGSASLSDYQTALKAVLFSTAGDNPVTGSRIISVAVTDSDGNGSAAAASLITVAAVNDAPALSVAENASYTENAAPITLSPSITLADADNATLAFAAVRIADGSFTSDGDILTIGGATSGTVNGITFGWSAAAHALIFIGAAALADYQSLLQGVEYQSTSDNPTDFNATPSRTINWTVSDGATTTTATTELDIVAVNDAPVASVAATATYTENGPPVAISPAATASDVDDINLVAGQVRIVTQLAGDTLTVNGLTSGTFSGVDFSFDPTAGRLLFGHPATVADFQAFMRAVEFSSASDDPTAGGAIPTRTLSWALFDGDVLSDTQTTILTITAINDPPVAQDGSASGTEDTAVGGTLVATDVDSPTLTYALGTQAAHGIVVVNPDGTYTYTPNQDFNGTDSFTFLANDTVTDSNTATITLIIAAINDPPVAQDGSASGTEDTPISGTLVATDIDSEGLTYRLGTQAAHGTVVVNPDGSYTYTPARTSSAPTASPFWRTTAPSTPMPELSASPSRAWPTRRSSISTPTTRPPLRLISLRRSPAPTCPSRTRTSRSPIRTARRWRPPPSTFSLRAPAIFSP